MKFCILKDVIFQKQSVLPLTKKNARHMLRLSEFQCTMKSILDMF